MAGDTSCDFWRCRTTGHWTEPRRTRPTTGCHAARFPRVSRPLWFRSATVPIADSVRSAAKSTAPAWTATKSFGLYSLIIGFAGFLLDFLCGIGVVVSIISTIVGVVALMRARKYNEPQGLAISGIVVGVLNIVFVFVVFVFLGSLSQMQF
jgi:hypothetical protein